MYWFFYFLVLSVHLCAAPTPLKKCDDCSKFVEDIWPIVPTGESQLTDILSKFLNYGSNWKVTFPKEAHYPTRLELLKTLYHSTDSPYVGLTVNEKMGSNVYRSNAQKNTDMLREYVLKVLGGPPRFSLEVGSFVGSGAVHTWGPLAQSFGPDGMLLCVDTWLGDINMRRGDQFQQFMGLKHGHPTVYHKFLNRVMFYNMTDTIFPFPMASLTAARMLQTTHWIVDSVYLDSAHEIGETFAELVLYYQLLRPGGLLMGDDYDLFPAVKHDVDLFVDHFQKRHSFKFEVMKGQWFIAKPKESVK